jgi:D-glycero-D-manno-heptose 1,7-bisphosphate phosphatase
MKLIILDRDGTINEDRDDFVKSPEEWVPLPGALEAIARLNHAGWHTVLATNQSGLGRGLFDMAMLNAMHVRMNQMLAKHGGRIDAGVLLPACAGGAVRLPQAAARPDAADRRALRRRPGRRAAGGRLAARHPGRRRGRLPYTPRAYRQAGQLDETQLSHMLQQVPGTQVHADLSAFADAIILHERQLKGYAGESDSGFGLLS